MIEECTCTYERAEENGRKFFKKIGLCNLHPPHFMNLRFIMARREAEGKYGCFEQAFGFRTGEKHEK